MTTVEEIMSKMVCSDNVVRAMTNRSIQKKKQSHLDCISAIGVINSGNGWDYIDVGECIGVLCDVQDYLEPEVMLEQLKFFIFASNCHDIIITQKMKDDYIAQHQAIIDSINGVFK
jgi:hypothetical protein